MGSKKKVVKEAKDKRDKAKIDERLKQIQSIEPPEQNPFKMDNEKKIDGFLRYGMMRRDPTDRLSIKQFNNKKNAGKKF